MTQSELIKEIAHYCDMTESRVNDVISELKNQVTVNLMHNEAVYLDGLGKFYVTDYKERTITTPQKIQVKLDARKSPRFKPSRKLKKSLL